jgi:hypothetical protein
MVGCGRGRDPTAPTQRWADYRSERIAGAGAIRAPSAPVFRIRRDGAERAKERRGGSAVRRIGG